MSGWIVAAVLVGIFGRGIFGRESVLVSLAWIRENVSDISGVFLAAVGVFMTVIPRKAARIEDNPIYIRTAGVVLIITAVTGLWSGSRDKKESREQIHQLLAASTTQATAADIAQLRKDINLGFNSLMQAINAVGDKLRTL
jgi:hypothetical protein